MEKPRVAKDLNEYQDSIFGHLINMRLYTPLCLCFPLQDASAQPKIIKTLTEGLERLSASFPWLAGQVVDQTSADGLPGLPGIVPLGKSCPLIVKDLTHDAAVPSMNALKKASFPSSMLDGTVLSPLNGPPTSHSENPAPVFFLQANFIDGGLLLICAGEHNVMDGQGLGQILRLFRKACNKEPFTEEELLQGNRARDSIIPLLDRNTYKPGPELDYLIMKPNATSTPSPDSIPPKCIWAYFNFSSSSLLGLKSIASSSSSISEDPTVPYTTTNDALSAFIWQSTSRVRSASLAPQTTSTFARAVDVRSSLSISSFYPFNMSHHTYNTLSLASVAAASLRTLASSLRLALDPSKLSYAIRSLATHLTFSSDKSSIGYGANMDFSTDIFFSSWARLPCYSFDFNLGLGFPECVRRPRYDPIEGLMYLMPMDRSGGVDALICLREEQVEGLKKDREFREDAEWIG
ncbi:hypothetical protein MMC13_002162 [Lambiella insularis]|nr:hypothetical protein [Lambiella insularis]